MTTTVALSADALEANRQGRLTDDQRKGWVGVERAWSRNFLFAAAFCAFIGVGLLVGFLSDRADPTRILGGVGFLAGAGVFGYIALFMGRPLASDLRDGKVASVEGALGREKRDNVEASDVPSTYFLEVGGQRFECGRAAYEAAQEPGIVRLYYLPRTRKVVNFERLPDRPLPPGALDDRATLATTLRDATSHDLATRDEAMATMEAMKHAVTAPPPASDAPVDPGQLAAAIVGTWRNPFVEATFDAAGTVRATLGNGAQVAGRWAVDATGKLHLDGMGEEEVTDARISGDALSLTLDATPLTLHRAGA